MHPTPPKHVDDITPAWLTAALRVRGHLPGDVEVIKTNRRILGEGVGFLSVMAHYALIFDRKPPPGTPSSLVVKLETQAEKYRKIVDELHAFEREIRFYEEVGPTAPLRLPKMYYTIREPHCCALVMEDLSYCQPGDQLAGMTCAQVEQIGGEIAKLQAMYWNNERLAALDWMPSTNNVEKHFQEEWPSFVDHYGGMIGPEAVTTGEKMFPRIHWIFEELGRAPKTICHYDLREDNILFGIPGTPEESIIVDWQLAIRGAGAYDIARLMAGSETPEQRRGHQLEICRHWHNALIENGVTGYSFDEALTHFKLSLMACAGNPVVCHKAVLEDNTGRTPLLMKAICQRTFASVLELDAVDLL